MKKSWYPYLHLVAWLLILFSDCYELLTNRDTQIAQSIKASGIPSTWFAIVFHGSYQLVSVVAFYGFYSLVGPLLFMRKKYLAAIACSIGVLAAMVLTRYLVEFHLVLPYLHFHNYFGNTPGTWWYIKNCIFYSEQYCLFGLLLYFLIRSNRMQTQQKAIEKEKIQAELSFLKSQVNPHFLFNTINDIYALTYQKSDRAPEALLKLSGMLRYLLHDSAVNHISLEKEMAYLNDYIALQRIGLKENLYFDMAVALDSGQQLIAPLLLIPFAENIFKHGIIDEQQHSPQMKISLQNHHFHLFTCNKIKRQQKDAGSGIGLANVQRRLQLLYPNRHQLQIEQTAETFTCNLSIELT